MRVLLFANVGGSPDGFYHVGDEAMFLESYREYQSTRPNDVLTAIVSQPNHQDLNISEVINPIDLNQTNKKYFFKIVLKSILYKSLKLNKFTVPELNLYNLISSQDRIHFCGGGNITSLFPSWLYHSLAIIAIATIQNKEIILSSQTIGPFNTIDNIISSLSLLPVKSIGIRGASHKSPLPISLPSRFYHMLDAAHTLPINTDYPIPKKHKNFIRIGLSLHQWKHSDRFMSHISDAINIVSKNYSLEVVLLPHVITNNPKSWDLGYMLTNLKLNKSIKVIVPDISKLQQSKPNPANAIKMLTSTADLNICTRYHGIIFSLSSSIPVITFVADNYYSSKNKGALEIYYRQGSENYFFSSKHIKPIRLVKMINNIIKNINQEKGQLQIINQELYQRFYKVR
jgi:polysaccharide pyruvyl transferase WcaK-like protein